MGEGWGVGGGGMERNLSYKCKGFEILGNDVSWFACFGEQAH